jgi:undecaprenyl diphosphate synthase
LISKIDEFHRQNIKLKIIGKKNFSKKLNMLLNSAEKKTSNNSKIQINLALNYGSKLELVNAVKMVSKKNYIINEKNIEKFLYTKNLPDPDILIRTGNTKRLSNFLLWQLAYSEIFFEKKLWPDFNQKDYSKIINKFKKIKRNYGNV